MRPPQPPAPPEPPTLPAKAANVLSKIVAPTQITARSSTGLDIPERLLVRWNLAMAAMHGSLIIITLSLANWNLDAPIYRTSLQIEYRNGTDGNWTLADDAPRDGGADRAWRVIPYHEEKGSINLTFLTAAFFFLSFFFHIGNATFWRRLYISELQHCRTPTRWVEYCLSAPVMFVLIAYGVGVRGRDVLLATATLISITMAFGHYTELRARPASRDRWELPLQKRLIPWVIGHFPQAIAWVLVLLQFYSNSWDIDRVPDFVHVIVFSELALFWSFGVAALISQLFPPRSFYKGELMFQVLSLLSKGLLGILLLTNIIMLSRFDDIYD